MITDAADSHVSAGRLAVPVRRAAVRVAALAWCVIPLLGFILVLASAYPALTHKRYGNANGSTGDLLARHSVGQSFVARHSGLSGVELQIGTYGRGHLPSPASLVLHLRDAPTPGPDLATVHLPAGSVLGENAWHLFSFPPLADSQGKTYYVEVESPDGKPAAALAVLSWKPSTVGDPYPHGTLHSDGQPVPGDLSFGLQYSPTPWDAWQQLGASASDSLPSGLLPALVIFCVALGLWIVLRVPALLSDPVELRNWLRRRSLPLVLAVAFLNGALYAALVPPWQGPDEFAHFAYVALLDKHGLDGGAVRRLDLKGADRDDALIQAINASMERNDYTRLVAGYYTPGGPVDSSAVLFQQVRQPPTYYMLGAAALRGVRAVGIPAEPYANPEAALLVVRVVSLLLSLGVVGLAWLAAGLLSPTRDTWLRLALPLTVGLLPMRAFADSVANNDVLAELAVSGLFVTLLTLFRRPIGKPGVAFAALAISLTLAGAWTKSTAIAASVPMLALGLAVWVGMLASAFLRRFRAVTIPAALALLLLTFAGLSLFAFEPGGVAGWSSHLSPTDRPARVLSTTAHNGRYVMQLDTRGKSGLAHQGMIPAAMLHPKTQVTLSGWARLAPEPSPAQPALARALIIVKEGQHQVGLGLATLDTPGVWVPLTATASVGPSAERVTLWVAADPSEQPVQFDDLTLKFGEMSQPWPDPAFWPELVNPSGEAASLALRPWLAALLPQEAEWIADTLLNPQPFDKRALWMRFADVQFRSYWGIFGWFSVPLPDALFSVVGILILVTLAGLARLAMRRLSALGAWSANEWLALVSLCSLIVAVLVGFARQMTLTAVAIPAYPQGRYLFVLIVPVAWLLIAGFASAWSSLWEWGRQAFVLLARRGARSPAEASTGGLPRPAWGVWLWLNALFLFAAYCLLALVVPYFHT